MDLHIKVSSSKAIGRAGRSGDTTIQRRVPCPTPSIKLVLIKVITATFLFILLIFNKVHTSSCTAQLKTENKRAVKEIGQSIPIVVSERFPCLLYSGLQSQIGLILLQNCNRLLIYFSLRSSMPARILDFYLYSPHQKFSPLLSQDPIQLWLKTILTPKFHVWILARRVFSLKISNYKCRFQTPQNWSTERDSSTWQCLW